MDIFGTNVYQHENMCCIPHVLVGQRSSQFKGVGGFDSHKTVLVSHCNHRTEIFMLLFAVVNVPFININIYATMLRLT